MGKTNTLHFTIGEDFGLRIMEIAQEHLIYNLDHKKAVKALTDSFVGMPEDLALKILKGSHVIVVDEADQSVIVTERDEIIHERYPKIDIRSWYRKEHKKIGDDLRSAYEYLGMSTRGIFRYGFEMIFDKDDIIRFTRGDNEGILETLRDDSRIRDISDVSRVVLAVILKADKLYTVLEWMDRVYPEELEFDYSDPMGSVSKGRHDVLNLLMTRYQNFCNNNSEAILEEIEEEDDKVRSYVNNAIEITKVLSKPTFEPMNILDNYSAGWLSPTGEYYGLNGDIGNMLHTNIADKLQEQGIIPEDVETVDSWLERNGWVKIHGNWILYGGWENEKLDRPVVPMTEIQKTEIVRYGKLCHKGMLKFGFKMEFISAARFEMTDMLMIRKLFEF